MYVIQKNHIYTCKFFTNKKSQSVSTKYTILYVNLLMLNKKSFYVLKTNIKVNFKKNFYTRKIFFI